MEKQELSPLWAVAASLNGLDVGGARNRERGRYSDRYGSRYGDRYGVGQSSAVPIPASSSVPASPGCIITSSKTFAGHGRATYDEHSYSCEIKPPRCNCHVIGGNTLNNPNFAAGVPTLGAWTVTLDSGDASFFVPYYIFVQAYEAGAVANLAITGPPLPTLLQDSQSGREPNLRRANVADPSFGIITTVYGQEKEIECVDWMRFASVNNQQLTLTGQNIRDVAIHVFVNVWGLPGA